MTGWTASNPDYAHVVPAVVLSMHAARHLGFTFARVEPGEVELHQPHRRELTQHDGRLQGGVLGQLADFAAGSAAGTLLPAGWVNLTVDYTVKIVAPAAGAVSALGRVVQPGKLLTVAAAEIHTRAGGEPELVATALVTLRNIRVGSS